MKPETIDYRVPKRRVRVELCVRRHRPRPCELFVAPRDDGGWRRLGVEEVLEGPQQFIPAYDLQAEATAMLNKHAIAWLRLERPEDEDPFADEGALFDRQERVQVELDDGEHLEGDLLYSPAPGQGRVADHLNGSGRFFTLWTDAGPTFVAKVHVVRVTDLTPAR